MPQPDQVKRFQSIGYEAAAGGQWVRYSDYEKLKVERDEARYRPMGDNHHNAAACPYCRPDLEEQREKLRKQRDEELRERLESRLDVQAAGVLELAEKALANDEAVRARKLEDDAAVTQNVKALLLDSIFEKGEQ